MNSLFIVLTLVAIVCLVVGLINPTKVKMQSRKKVSIVFGITIIILFFLIGVTSKQTQTPIPEVTSVVTPTPVVSTPQTTQSTASIPVPIPQKKTSTPVVTPVVAPQPTPPAPTSAPVATPAPVAPAPSAPAPITISGTGQTASRQFTLQQGLAVFNMKYTGAGNFIVDLLDSNGNEIGNLSNKIGSYNGSQALQIPNTGSYLFNVQAGSATQSGTWSITINQPVPYNTPSTTTFSGTGDEATQFFHLSKGLHTFNLSYTGGGNFIVQLLDQDGDQIQNLENAIGSTSGSTAVQIDTSGAYLFDIIGSSATAGGSWNIQIQ